MRQDRISKICGGDIELANFILRARGKESKAASLADTADEASRRLLVEIQGFPKERKNADSPQDWGRKFLSENGGCVYIDLNHLELCLPEVSSAHEHLSAWFAMLKIAEGARQAANRKLPNGDKIEVLANNSDGLGHSYGSHLNFLLTRECFENLMGKRPDLKQYFLSYLISSIVVSGQGKVGSENGSPQTGFQISQRADFFETIEGKQTTYRRPLLNTRDEPHAGFKGEEGAQALARLHVIFFDSNLCHVAHFLKIGVTQLILAMLEENNLCNPDLILGDPLNTLKMWSHDPNLTAQGTLLVSKKKRTAVEIQRGFWEEAEKFVARGGSQGIVPHAEFILQLWQEVLCDLENRNWDSLAPRLDWVLKKRILEEAMGRRCEMKWDSPQTKHLDHLYSSLNEEEGLFWIARNSGFVEELVTQEEIEQLRSQPPSQTRAFLRAHLLRKAGECVENMDWSWLNIRPDDSSATTLLLLPRPDKGTAEECASLFEGNTGLEKILRQLYMLQGKRGKNNESGRFSLRRMMRKMKYLAKKLCVSSVNFFSKWGSQESSAGASPSIEIQNSR
ncbi:MAG: proteasome accessory factor PafA2 family protein [Candidatus Brocadiae bacterium]|nr:proteasome accessory factor PafA2 family protein [Candidatus Brocadiia bacterium]